jgi:predicted RNA-binding Zn ribbon-like protein
VSGAERFSFHRGSLALDFIGTLGRRASPEPEERLPDAASLAAWLREAGLPAPARIDEGDVAQVRAVREALFQLGVQASEGRPFDRAMLRALNLAARGRTSGALQLDGSGRSGWRTDDALRCAIGAIAEDAILRFTADRERLARCELPGCGALLLSRSRSDPRRWCSMETCGNRAKAAAFRSRQRGERSR